MTLPLNTPRWILYQEDARASEPYQFCPVGQSVNFNYMFELAGRLKASSPHLHVGLKRVPGFVASAANIPIKELDILIFALDWDNLHLVDYLPIDRPAPDDLPF